MGRSETVRFWRGVVERYGQSSKTVEEFCRREGVSSASFYAWRKRLREEQEEDDTRSPAPRFAAVRLVDQTAAVTMTSPDGWRVCIHAGCEAGLLTAAVAALRQEPER